VRRLPTKAESSEGATRLKRFPQLMKFVANSQVSSEHPVWGLEDGLLRALDFFFSLPELPGIADQKQRFLRLGQGDGFTNEAETQEASFWAEIRATSLLNGDLGAQILGFEQPSPRRQSGTCDIVAKFEGSKCFFEVKRKSADVRQKIPVLLETALTALAKEIGFALTPQLQQRDYNCADLPSFMNEIKAYVIAASRDDRGIPIPFRNGVIEVFFSEKDDSDIWSEYVQPDLPEDIERYLLGRRDGQRDADSSGGTRHPMVEQCRRKGADYLVSQIGFIESPEQIAKASFPEITQMSPREWATKDSRLSGLSGIVLFRTNFEWCLVRNSAMPSVRLTQRLK
jgi:hypothetical protein